MPQPSPELAPQPPFSIENFPFKNKPDFNEMKPETQAFILSFFNGASDQKALHFSERIKAREIGDIGELYKCRSFFSSFDDFPSQATALDFSDVIKVVRKEHWLQYESSNPTPWTAENFEERFYTLLSERAREIMLAILNKRDVYLLDTGEPLAVEAEFQEQGIESADRAIMIKCLMEEGSFVTRELARIIAQIKK